MTGSGGQLRRGGSIDKSPFSAKIVDTTQVFLAVEIFENDMTFNAISRTGQVVDSRIDRAPGRQVAPRRVTAPQIWAQTHRAGGSLAGKDSSSVRSMVASTFSCPESHFLIETTGRRHTPFASHP